MTLLVTLYCLTIGLTYCPINHREIMCKNIMYCPHRGCVLIICVTLLWALHIVIKQQLLSASLYFSKRGAY